MTYGIDQTNLITVESKFEGSVEFSGFTRFDGAIEGVLIGRSGSEIIVGPNGVVEGQVLGDVVIIDGFVRGTVEASGKIIVTETGRVVGTLRAPNVAIRFGAYFEGDCQTQLNKPLLTE